MRFEHGGDGCLSIWADCYEGGPMSFPEGAKVLEVGCAEADWMTPMLAVRPDLQIVGIDCRRCERPAPTIEGDVLTYEWPDASFDAVVGVSSIEHIGLTHYGDPADPDGDTHCMERVVRWLKPGGWVYLDVPYDPAGYREDGTSHRVYDERTLSRLIVPGLTLKRRWFAPGEDKGLFDEPPTAPIPWAYAYVALYAVKE